jgi:hypothetical protein
MGTAKLVIAAIVGAGVGSTWLPLHERWKLNRAPTPYGYWAAVDRYAANDKPGAEDLLRECRDDRCRDLRETMRIASVSNSDELYVVGHVHFAEADFEIAKLLFLECLKHQPGETRCRSSLKVTYDTLGDRAASHALGELPVRYYGF